ncbi:MAG TPA: pyridoxal 5'-phosphate synthase glutaminase subunit PdxT [Thermoleophilaceae bacterium]
MWRRPRASSARPCRGSRSPRSRPTAACSRTAAGSSLIGVLAIQGDFEAHARALAEVGAEAREVRVPADLEGLDGLVIPGGESTTMSLGIEREGLAEPLREFVRSGRPVLGTCAGMIMLDREHLGLLDVTARRNAFGRQLHSFEADLDVDGMGAFRAVFIRAPWVEDHGPGVEVLAEVDGHPVAVRQGNILAVAFHPELTEGRGVHRWLLESAGVRA